MKTEKFVVYLRVSTARQGTSGLGLEAQQKAVSDYLAGRKAVVLDQVVEVESGKRSDRPELSRALSLCRLHGATLLVAKFDRLARNARFLLGIIENGIEAVACDMPSANRLTIGILAMVAEEEARMISSRTKAALAAAKVRGVKLGNPANLTRTAMAKGRVLAVKSRQATASIRAKDIQPQIDALRSAGITTLAGIADALNEQGIATPRGAKWHPNSIRRLLARIG